MISASVNGQSRTAGDVACFWKLSHGELFIARPKRRLREHLCLPCPTVIPLGTRSDLKRTHVGRNVHARDVESQRCNAVILVSLPRRGKVPMPWLHLRTLKGRIEANLDDLVLGPENGLTHCDHPVVRYKIHKATDRLRVQLDIPSPRA